MQFRVAMVVQNFKVVVSSELSRIHGVVHGVAESESESKSGISPIAGSSVSSLKFKFPPLVPAQRLVFRHSSYDCRKLTTLSLQKIYGGGEAVNSNVHV